jgi:hypothetical protein
MLELDNPMRGNHGIGQFNRSKSFETMELEDLIQRNHAIERVALRNSWNWTIKSEEIERLDDLMGRNH